MATLSGQKTVTTAGTAVQLSSSGTVVSSAVLIKALSTNTGIMYIGNVDNDVDSTNGFALSAGDSVILESVSTLSNIWVDSSVNGEKVCWILTEI